jgi:aspartate/tyrosine/aromatic aminotransferase
MSFFKSIKKPPEDPIFGLNVAFKADMRPHKINLVVGEYRSAEGEPLVLSVVKKAEAYLLEENLNKEYLPIEGDRKYIQHTLQLIFGLTNPNLIPQNIIGFQTVGGTSALRLAGELILQEIPNIYIPEPSWANHRQIFSQLGMRVHTYPYYNHATQELDFSGICQAIEKMAPRSLILLHACCHNPTGIDLTEEQWLELSGLIKHRRHLPFFDLAYQGFGSGCEEDAKAIRLFLREGHEMFVAYSFAKNMGLYGERAGALALVCWDPQAVVNVQSNAKRLIRTNYSNPPLHAARIVTSILDSPKLTEEWKQELAAMRNRIKEIRHAFARKLQAANLNKNFEFFERQSGLFSLSGLSADQVSLLQQEYAIFMPSNGRINMAGINRHNMDSLVNAFAAVLG